MVKLSVRMHILKEIGKLEIRLLERPNVSHARASLKQKP